MQPGHLIHHEPIDTAITGARAWRVRYLSRDLAGRDQEATGLVIAPAAAGADRPILTWCHGTTGLGDAACPSAQPDPARELTAYFTPGSTRQIDYGVPGLQAMIDAGWVVCATDYQGLGSPGVHQYTVGATNGRDSVFIARAARHLDPGAGTKLGVIGWSEGGNAAAAVAELDPADFGELDLVGSVLYSPGVPIMALAHPVGESVGLSDPTATPTAHLLMILKGMAAAFDDIDVADILTPLGVEVIETAWNTQPVHHLDDVIKRQFRLKGAMVRSDPQNFDAWKAAIARSSAGQKAPRCPLLLCVDTFGGGLVVPVPWQDAYQQAVEAHGGQIERIEFPDDDHFSLPQAAAPQAQAWLAKHYTT
jgi:dienelactone hydrolase